MTQHILTVSSFLLNPISEFLRSLSALPNSIASSMKQSKSARNTIKELQSLTDKELNDIGIARGDIYYIAHNLKEVKEERASLNNNLKGWV